MMSELFLAVAGFLALYGAIRLGLDVGGWVGGKIGDWAGPKLIAKTGATIEWSESTPEDEAAVLKVLRDTKRPVGWYPIAQTLSMRGTVLKGRLPTVLDGLVQSGLVKQRTTYELADK